MWRTLACVGLFEAWVKSESSIDFWDENNALERLTDIVLPFIAASRAEGINEMRDVAAAIAEAGPTGSAAIAERIRNAEIAQ